MIVHLVAVGRPRAPLARAIGAYEARAARYWKLRVDELASGAGRGGSARPGEVMRKEGERVLATLRGGGSIVALTRTGKGLASEGLARYLERHALAASDVAFVIGGAHGLAQDVLGRATLRLSLSPMTLPHELARLVLAEQLYRAGTIVRGEPYHKGGA